MGDFPSVQFPPWINKLHFKHFAGMGIFSYTLNSKGSAARPKGASRSACGCCCRITFSSSSACGSIYVILMQSMEN